MAALSPPIGERLRSGLQTLLPPSHCSSSLPFLANAPDAQAVFLSGTGMPTIEILQALEQDLSKPALSANSAMMWYA
jgi:maleate cis-trans isomerase